MPEDILQKLKVDIILKAVKKFFVWSWRRVVGYYTTNSFDFLPFILVMFVFPVSLMMLPPLSNLFVVCLFGAALGVSTITTGLIGIFYVHNEIPLPELF